jgi:hypothetical protein
MRFVFFLVPVCPDQVIDPLLPGTAQEEHIDFFTAPRLRDCPAGRKQCEFLPGKFECCVRLLLLTVRLVCCFDTAW